MDCGLASGSGNLKVSVNKRKGTIGEKTEDVNEGGAHSWNKIPQGLCDRGKVGLRKAIPVYPLHSRERRVWNLLQYISKGSGKIN